MLTIRKKQFKAFQPVAEETFLKRVVAYLREEHADAAVRLPEGETTVSEIPDETLRAMTRDGIARARGYGITWRSTLNAFVVLMFESAPNFDAHPVVRHVLTDESIAPNLRVEALWERTSEANWEAVAQSYEASAWRLKWEEDSR